MSLIKGYRPKCIRVECVFKTCNASGFCSDQCRVIHPLEKENAELKANWESLKTELKNAAKLDVLFGEEDEVAKVSIVATLNIMSKLEGGEG